MSDPQRRQRREILVPFPAKFLAHFLQNLGYCRFERRSIMRPRQSVVRWRR
jgi:hypothetical protein